MNTSTRGVLVESRDGVSRLFEVYTYTSRAIILYSVVFCRNRVKVEQVPRGVWDIGLYDLYCCGCSFDATVVYITQQ